MISLEVVDVNIGYSLLVRPCLLQYTSEEKPDVYTLQ
jgi:hypothetical protein